MLIYSNFDDLILIMLIYYNFDDLNLNVCTADQKVHSLTEEKWHGARIDLRARPPQVKTLLKLLNL